MPYCLPMASCWIAWSERARFALQLMVARRLEQDGPLGGESLRYARRDRLVQQQQPGLGVGRDAAASEQRLAEQGRRVEVAHLVGSPEIGDVLPPGRTFRQQALDIQQHFGLAHRRRIWIDPHERLKTVADLGGGFGGGLRLEQLPV
ncbi:MAG: hypothetical protein K0Q69_1977, partial [Devosia sp.]|nr:hypothetical protein [Devosia sp.]